jgi:hypothetical protein
MLECGADMVCVGVDLRFDRNSRCLLARMTGAQCTLLLPIPLAALKELEEGAILRLEIAGLDCEGYAAILAASLDAIDDAAQSDGIASGPAASEAADSMPPANVV